MACAFPIEHVVETMRPLPIAPIGQSDAQALALVDGVAMIRGVPVPIVDARRLLGQPAGRAERLVVVRIADRRIGLLVDAVVGVTQLELDHVSRLPPLLGGAGRDSVTAIGSCDAGLLVVLDAARVLPEASWHALESGEPQR